MSTPAPTATRPLLRISDRVLFVVMRRINQVVERSTSNGEPCGKSVAIPYRARGTNASLIPCGQGGVVAVFFSMDDGSYAA